MIASIQQMYKTTPLRTILLAGLLIRLVAAVFAQGYGMHDDHFLVVEQAQSWLDGHDYGRWLPEFQTQNPPQAKGHSFFYPGIHFVLFAAMDGLANLAPTTKMLIIRILHAFWSLLVIFFAYKITEKYSTPKRARLVGWVLALGWFMPWISVRNLVEVFSIPFLLWSFWLIINAEERKKTLLKYLFAGFLIGFAVSVRYQTGIFAAGLGLALLFQKKWLQTIVLTTGALITFLCFQLSIDMAIWGFPFAEMQGYIDYNIEHRHTYGNNLIPMYFYLLAGVFFIPLGLYLMFGFFASWRKYFLLFLPTFFFLIFHTIFPNKQERFVLTIVPMFLMLGVMGWCHFIENSRHKNKLLKWHKVGLVIFWVLNFLLLPFLSTHYSKKARVESMLYLAEQSPDLESFIVEESTRSNTIGAPRFYLGDAWSDYYRVSKNEPMSQMKNTIEKAGHKPEYVLFVSHDNLEERVENMKKYYPALKKEVVIKPSFIDDLVHKINPVNKNETIYIYATRAR